MAKKSKDTTTSTTKAETKVKAPPDPVAVQNLIKLLNILALLLAITAFVLQFFAVVTHHWKHQVTHLQPLFAPQDRPLVANVADDSKIDQHYGLYSRHVKVYSNNDQQLNVWTSTKFPKLDNGDEDLHQCLAQTSTFRSALLTCSKGINSAEQCHCRRYPYWNAVIFFEIAALVLLGLVVAVTALLSIQYGNLLKLVGAALAFLAFLFLLIGLILILSYLKRETRTIADTFPHAYSKISNQINSRYQTVLHKAIRRQAHETYRAYSLSPGQHPFNQTHFQQFSEKDNAWIYIPYTSLAAAPYVPRTQKGPTSRTTTAQAQLRNPYGPAIGYDEVYGNTTANIGGSTILSILALVLALLVPLLLAFSWLKGKTPGTNEKKTTTTTTTTITTGYIPVAQDITAETAPLNQPIIVESPRQETVAASNA